MSPIGRFVRGVILTVVVALSQSGRLAEAFASENCSLSAQDPARWTSNREGLPLSDGAQARLQSFIRACGDRCNIGSLVSCGLSEKSVAALAVLTHATTLGDLQKYFVVVEFRGVKVYARDQECWEFRKDSADNPTLTVFRAAVCRGIQR